MKEFFAAVAPVPFTHIPKVVEMVVETGWSYVDGFQIGIVLPKKSILAGLNNQQSQGIPAFSLLFCKEGMEDSAPEFPSVDIDKM
jgi:hypothetical protein